jgi:hypothetical protein
MYAHALTYMLFNSISIWETLLPGHKSLLSSKCTKWSRYVYISNSSNALKYVYIRVQKFKYVHTLMWKSWLPDFSWHNIPKWENIPSGHKIYVLTMLFQGPHKILFFGMKIYHFAPLEHKQDEESWKIYYQHLNWSTACI